MKFENRERTVVELKSFFVQYPIPLNGYPRLFCFSSFYDFPDLFSKIGLVFILYTSYAFGLHLCVF